MQETVIKSDIIYRIRDDTGLHLVDVEAVLNSLLGIIEDELAHGNRVQLSGFGTFEIKDRASRIGRDWQDGKVEIPAKRVPCFIAGERLKRAATKLI